MRIVVDTSAIVAIMQEEPETLAFVRLLDVQDIAVIALDREQVILADDGMRRFGKGRGEAPAALDLGDLFAYALARKLDAPLLFKGNDFSQTDIIPALAS